MIKLLVVLAAVVGAIALADGRFAEADIGAARDAVAGAYTDAKDALANAQGGVDEPTRRQLEDARAQLADAVDELELASTDTGGETARALDSARRKLERLERADRRRARRRLTRRPADLREGDAKIPRPAPGSTPTFPRTGHSVGLLSR